MKNFYLILLFLITPAKHSFGVNDTVFAKLDTNCIQIGQQTRLKLIYSGTNKSINFPVLPDTFSKIEIITRGNIDTLSNGINDFSLSQSFTVTSFDSGYHVILPFQFVFIEKGKIDSTFLSTNPLLIQVKTMDIDTTKAIKDIKDIEDVPFEWMDYLPWALAIVVLTTAIWLLWRKLSRRHKTIPQPLEKKIPAEEKAMQSLMMLEQKSLWQQGKFRQYHTELTDILRTFITERWEVSAMEMTTDEILSLSFIKKTHETDGLSYVLKTADLVKFAKSVPVIDENVRCMQLAKSFVTENKITPLVDSTITNQYDQ